MGHNWDPDDVFGADVSADPLPPMPSAPRPADPAVRLARLFGDEWVALCADHRELRGVRGIDRGPAVGYLRSVMLRQMTPEHIERYIVEFMRQVDAGEVRIRDGQSTWQRFTGWWGTSTVIHEPGSEPARSRRLVRRRPASAGEQ